NTSGPQIQIEEFCCLSGMNLRLGCETPMVQWSLTLSQFQNTSRYFHKLSTPIFIRRSVHFAMKSHAGVFTIISALMRTLCFASLKLVCKPKFSLKTVRI